MFMPVGTAPYREGRYAGSARSKPGTLILAQYLSPRPCAGDEIIRDLGGFAQIHGLERPDPHRFRRLFRVFSLADLPADDR